MTRTTKSPVEDVPFANWVAGYADNAATHGEIYRTFTAAVQASPRLRAHRDFVEANEHGYGDRAFHHLWKLLVDTMPTEFRFLEVGVFKGQVLSLMRMLSDAAGKAAKIVGVTPLCNAGDRYSDHDACDYADAIQHIHRQFDLDMADTRLVVGYSQDARVIQTAAEHGPYDIVYIDGCHELEEVVSDLTYYPQMLKPGGYLVVDDAGLGLDLPSDLFPGLQFVSLAAQQILDPDPNYEVQLACGHNRVWRKRAAGGVK